MPKFDPYAVGSTSVATATANKRQTLASSGAGIVNSLELLTEGMPRLYFWIAQTVGAVGLTVQPQFMVRASPAPGAGDEWLPLIPPVVLVPGSVPTIIEQAFPATKIRLQFTGVALQASTVELVLGCSSAT
jgi:hypothetical protein